MLYITIVIHGDFTGIKGSCITNVIKFQNKGIWNILHFLYFKIYNNDYQYYISYFE